MAKYDVTHTCGHTENYQLYGKHTERERRIAWLETRPCTACHRDQLAAAAAQAAESIRESGAVEGLPALEGTERQVNWAESIRVEAMRRMDADLTRIAERVEAARAAGNPTIEELEDQAAAIGFRWVDCLKNPSARWWIDEGQQVTTYTLARQIEAEAEGRIEREKAVTEEERKRAEALEKRQRMEAKVGVLCDRWHAAWGRPRDGEYVYRVTLWDRGADRRVYIATRDASIGNNVVEYYHTGNNRYKSGTLHVNEKSLADAVARRGVDAEAIKAEIKALCVDICGWKSLSIDDTKVGW